MYSFASRRLFVTVFALLAAMESAAQADETVMGVGGDGESTSRLQHLDKEELPEGGVPEPAPDGG